MLEGVRSQSTAVKCFVQSWVKFAAERAEVGRLLQPLVAILAEAEAERTSTLQSKRADKAVSSYGKYYFAGKYHDPEEGKTAESGRDEFESVALQYSQVFDVSQVLYALSLICSVIAVDPDDIVGCLGSEVVDVNTYTCLTSSQGCLIATKFHSVPLPSSSSSSNPMPHSETQTPATPSPVAPKSLLELLLASCVDFLRSEYPESLEASVADQLNNQRVKIAAAELISVLLRELVLILSQHKSAGAAGAGVLQNPSYVSALVTLCDTQNVVLLLLSRVLQNLRDSYGKDELRENSSESTEARDGKEFPYKERSGSSFVGGDGETTSQETLFVHLLKCIQNLITLDAQCNPATPATTATLLTPNLKNPDVSVSQLPPVLASLPTAVQPLFQVLLLNVLEDFSLVHLHRPLLCMFIASLPNLQSNLDELAPKVLKQICKNLERAHQSEKDREGQKHSRKNQRDSQLLSSEYIISYLESLVTIILWCLFGETLFDSHSGTARGQLNYRSLNMFWNGTTYTEAEDSGDSLSPASKQPSTMAWLFGVFTANQRSSPSEGGGKVTQIGIDSRVGQYVLMLLPAVYNAVTDVWKHFSSRASSAIGGGSGQGGQRSTAAGLFGLQEEDVGAERRRRMEFEVRLKFLGSVDLSGKGVCNVM